MKWRQVLTNDVLDIRDGTHDSPKYQETGYPLITSKNLKEGEIDFSDVNLISEEDYIAINKRSKVQKGDILYSMIGSIGNYAIVEKEPEYAIKNVALFKFTDERLDNRFFLYLLKSSIINNQINKSMKGGTQKFVSLNILRNLQIPLPPLDQQKKIASILDAADAYRQKTKALLAKYDELTQSLFLDMFGDPVKNEKGWEKEILNNVCSKITDGTHDTPKRLLEGVKFITGKHIRPFEIDYKNSDYVTEEVHKEIYKRCNPEFGDILYTNIGVNFATAAMNTVDYEFSMKNVALLKYKRDKLNGRFLECLLNDEFFKDKLKKSFGIGGAQQFLSLSNIKSIQVLCPPLILQNQFAERVQVIEQQKASAQVSYEKAEELFNSLLQKAFSGELS